MTKTRDNSRIEVWSKDYINNPGAREEEHERATVIIQMEPGNTPGDYIVEVVDG